MYVQSDTLLLTDVFVNLRNMSPEIYDLDPACMAWQAVLKITKAKIDLLSDTDILLMVEKD